MVIAFMTTVNWKVSDIHQFQIIYIVTKIATVCFPVIDYFLRLMNYL